VSESGPLALQCATACGTGTGSLIASECQCYATRSASERECHCTQAGTLSQAATALSLPVALTPGCDCSGTQLPVALAGPASGVLRQNLECHTYWQAQADSEAQAASGSAS
jgi:hypothetical protein